ncbi:MAG: hypothetical protein J0H25_09935 [Rhizobiales bacterium]|jgi:hypothetical protein|nr:hypothetical protein [Hyphomicrobiales bacterium]
MTTLKTPPVRASRQTLSQIFGWPLVIGVLSTVGLIAALVGDGIWDGVSWLALLLPILLYALFLLRPRR